MFREVTNLASAGGTDNELGELAHDAIECGGGARVEAKEWGGGESCGVKRSRTAKSISEYRR